LEEQGLTMTSVLRLIRIAANAFAATERFQLDLSFLLLYVVLTQMGSNALQFAKFNADSFSEKTESTVSIF
jgi:hypothetical protein